MNKQEEEHEETSFSAIKVVFITLGIIFLLVAALAGGGAYYVYTSLQPIDPHSEELVQVEIPLGSSAAKIASILEEQGLVKNDKIFYYYVRLKQADGLQAGEYFIPKSSGADEIIEQLKEGKVHLATVRFTIPEGWHLEQIAEQLEKEGLANKERFLQVVNEGDFSQFDFMKEIPDIKERKYRLEGFLFPETYDVFKGASEEEIITIMLTQFEKEFKPEWQEALAKRKMSMYEVLTLASIVEKEAVVPEERKTIAGVFTNRIRDNWNLQSCATVQFALGGKAKERLLFEDLEVKSPYNTYIHAGLPPSPIASPGRASIEAAIFPEEHNYYFFVTKKDGSGSHHFSKTFEEHLKHDAQSRGNF